MLNMVVYYHCKRGLRGEFINALERENLAKLCRAEHGCVQYEYFIPLEDADTLLLLEKWETEDAQSVHVTMPHFKVLSGLKEQFVERVEIERILQK